jgi:hypothetical protein
MYRDALDVRTKMLTADHPATASTLCNLVGYIWGGVELFGNSRPPGHRSLLLCLTSPYFAPYFALLRLRVHLLNLLATLHPLRHAAHLEPDHHPHTVRCTPSAGLLPEPPSLSPPVTRHTNQPQFDFDLGWFGSRGFLAHL